MITWHTFQKSILCPWLSVSIKDNLEWRGREGLPRTRNSWLRQVDPPMEEFGMGREHNDAYLGGPSGMEDTSE